MQVVHRSGPLKQKNKPHKVVFRSNRQLKNAAGGRSNSSLFSSTLRRKQSIESRKARHDRAQMNRRAKREQVLDSKRRVGQLHNSPLLVTILHFAASDGTKQSRQHLLKLLTQSDDDGIVKQCELGRTYFISTRLKLRFNFILPEQTDLFANMDAVKVSDLLLCVYDAQSEQVIQDLRSSSDSLLNSIYSHCLPTTVHAIHNLESVPLKKRNDIKKSIQKVLTSLFPDEKFNSLDNRSEAQQLLNILGNCKRRRLCYRERRSQLLVDKFEYLPNAFVANDSSIADQIGTLKAYGFVRNQKLNVNLLLHLPGAGNFQMQQIEILDDPYQFNTRKAKQPLASQPDSSNGDTMETESDSTAHVPKFYKADPLVQEELESALEIDPMEGEQTFPTPEEIQQAQEERLKRKKLVPKGTSDYQAAWLIDDDGDLDEDADDEDDYSTAEEYDDTNDMNDGIDAASADDSDNEQQKSEFGDDDQLETMTEMGEEDEYDNKVNIQEDIDTLEKIKEEKMNEMYPDEVETPMDTQARVRFARYRGLKSFHKSSWDRNENLPSDYMRIHQFANFNRSKKLALQLNDEGDGAEPGSYVCITLKNVSKQQLLPYTDGKRPMLLNQLLRHEQKMSLMNIVLKKHPNFTQPIKSKERLIFHIGCRRFGASPIFSGHSNGDKHKYERFLRTDIPIVASIYAPVTYPPASVCVFKEFSDGSHHLVATGSLLSIDPNRIIVKRIILSGHPYKIHKTFAVIRYMFFNRDDIFWFKPVELRTKYGRKGHIKEPLGTHGHMKCTFDRAIKSNDTVLMHLYKRVYPKWTYDESSLSWPVCSQALPQLMSQEEMHLDDDVNLDNDEMKNGMDS